MDNRVRTCRAWFRQRRWAVQHDGQLGLMTEKIEIVGKGTDLKSPGSHTVLVDCVGQHGRNKNRNGYRQDQDAQSLHRSPDQTV